MKKTPRAPASGRFVLRIAPGLHAALRASAKTLGWSLNDFCARRLAATTGAAFALEGADEVVARAAERFGDALVGVLLHGSWVRGEAVDGSDVDVLVVLDAGIGLSRDLYRTWDAHPLTIDGRPVEAHFVHPPATDRGASALWAEAALDGLVLFERGLELSAVLARVRRAIASGRLVRRTAHGQPYWTESADTESADTESA